MDRHFCGVRFLHTANQLIKDNFSALDREQGNVIEQMLRSEMGKKGYSFNCGNYFSNNNSNLGECDLVLRKSKLVFVEIKKKSIANELDVLDDVSLLENLAPGMVRAQKQCFIHEKNLKTYGELVFKKSGEKLVYENGILPAYKISVCFPEYTFLTNKMFSMNLLEILLCGEFRAVDPGFQIKLDKLNALGSEIRQCISTQYTSKSVRARDITFNSLFCRMQQILTAVWYCDNEDEFFNVLSYWIHFSDKSLDPYLAILMSNSNNEVTNAMLRLAEKPGMNLMILGE